ncbi:DUF6624 domain-containing protein [Caulobacter segnis]
MILTLQAPPALSPDAAARIAPVAAAIKSVQDAQSRLPPPANDGEALVRMVDVEQAGRRAMMKVDLHDLPQPERNAAFQAMWGPISAIDKANQHRLLAMLPPEGWFYKSKYGSDAAEAAFLIVQHADLDLWRRFVPVLEPLVAKGEVKGSEYALMFDRLALKEGRPQRYGSQLTCKDGKFVVDTLEDPDHVDERRKAMGFDTTLAENAKRFADLPPCN